MKSLVVYYPRTGNTRFVAEKIAHEIGADCEEIIDKKKRSGLFGFIISGWDAMREKETEIAETKKLPKDYDLIVVGTPVWSRRLTPPVRTYLKRNGLSAKKVALFCTNRSSGSEKTFAGMKELMSNSNFVGELVVTEALKNSEDSEKKIAAWCKAIKSNKR